MKSEKLNRELGVTDEVVSQEELLEDFVQEIAQTGDAKAKERVNTILYNWENRSVKDIVKELLDAGFPVEAVANKFGRILKKATVMRFRARFGKAIKEFRVRKQLGWRIVDNK